MYIHFGTYLSHQDQNEVGGIGMDIDAEGEGTGRCNA